MDTIWHIVGRAIKSIINTVGATEPEAVIIGIPVRSIDKLRKCKKMSGFHEVGKLEKMLGFFKKQV